MCIAFKAIWFKLKVHEKNIFIIIVTLQIAFALFVACAFAAPQQPVETLKFVNDIKEDGYNFL